MPLGVVSGIFREGDPQDPGTPTPYVEATIAGAGGLIPCRYYGNPPPPLSICEFSEIGGSWFCEGTRQADFRTVFHEDFTICPTVTVSGTTLGADTPWGTFLFGTGSRIDALTGSGLGVCRLTAGNANGRAALAFKTVDSILPSTADAYWLHSRAQLGTSAASIIASIGFSDGAGTADVAFARFAPTAFANWAHITAKDTVFGGAETPVVGAVDGYHDFDIILNPGVFSALWIDGSGPYVDTATVPAGTDTLTIFLWVVSLTTATKTLDVDSITLTAINGDIAHPTEHPLLI